MRKLIIISCISASLFIIALQFGFFSALALFLLAGIIPGTNYALSPNSMFVLVTIISLIVIFRIVWTSRYKRIFVTRLTMHKKRLPKRRFSEI